MGTAKRGGASSPHTRTTLNFIRPAGQKLTLLSIVESGSDAEVEASEIHGEGSTAPIEIAYGHGSGTFKGSISEEEAHLVIAKAKAANVTVIGSRGLRFDVVQTTSVPGETKKSKRYVGCGFSSFNFTVSAEGNRYEFEAKPRQIEVDGVKMWEEPA
jgi:hypothetical protein